MRRRHSFRQRGQILPLAAILLLAVAATLFYLFNSGQLMQEKLRLTNTADAVAYSAGIFEARMLNYDAFANRAIIANQIAIGQAVGLASWAKYMGTSAQSIRPYLYLIPAVGAALAQAMDYFESAMEALTPALAAAVTRHDAAVQALALSQQMMHGPGDAVAVASRLALMQRVARENDPRVVVDPLPLGDDLIGFTHAHATRDDRRRMGTLVNDSREAFLQSRDWNFGAVLLCHGIELRKRGSTELIDLVDGWKSIDSLSAHHHRVRRWRCRRSERPIGYGSAASDAELADGIYSYGGSRSTNPRASARAESADGIARGFDPSATTVGGGAIPTFRDLSERARAMSEPSTRLTIRVTKSSAAQRFSGGSSSVKPTGRLQRFDGAMAGGVSAAISSVEVFFERPDAGNTIHPGRSELGSLFNPYWQARLAPVSAAARAQAQLRQGSAQLP
ncbi:MAG TPA: hypothetical protein DCL01_05825 [Thauera sp.]|nr:hypothetical protein [Thauera sp.]HHW64857.1 hypothetical protein [Rhodocyclaceae bacterium]